MRRTEKELINRLKTAGLTRQEMEFALGATGEVVALIKRLWTRHEQATLRAQQERERAEKKRRLAALPKPVVRAEPVEASYPETPDSISPKGPLDLPVYEEQLRRSERILADWREYAQAAGGRVISVPVTLTLPLVVQELQGRRWKNALARPFLLATSRIYLMVVNHLLEHESEFVQRMRRAYYRHRHPDKRTVSDKLVDGYLKYEMARADTEDWFEICYDPYLNPRLWTARVHWRSRAPRPQERVRQDSDQVVEVTFEGTVVLSDDLIWRLPVAGIENATEHLIRVWHVEAVRQVLAQYPELAETLGQVEG